MRAFITATGTEIGKTAITCLLLKWLRRHGQQTLALKPVLTGYDDHTWQDSDPARLLQAQGWPVDAASIAAISPWRLAAPLSPDMAGRQEGKSLAYAPILQFCRDALKDPARSVLIEGIGGVCVPLNDDATVLDLMADLALPVVLVTGSYLGTLSHTLTALLALKARGLKAVVLVNETPGSDVDLGETAATLRRHGGTAVVALHRQGSAAAQDAACARIVQAAAADA